MTFIVAAGCGVHEDARVVGTLLLLFCVRDLLAIAKLLLSSVARSTTVPRNQRRWLRGTVVERRSLTGELSLSCARPAADG